MNTATLPKNKGRPRQFDRESALNQALMLFWQQGYEQTSIGDLCNAMNINPPSLYAAFGNKKELFCATLEYYVRQYWDSVWAQIDVHTDVFVAVEQFFQAAAKMMKAQNMPQGCMIFSQAWQTNDPDIQAWANQKRAYCMNRFCNRIQRAISDKQLKPNTNIELLATLLHVYLEGISSYAYSGSGDNLPTIAAHSVDLLRDFQTA